MGGRAVSQSEEMCLDESQRKFVDLCAAEQNATQVALRLGVSRSTVYRRMNEPGVREAIQKKQIELDGKRNVKVEKAQDAAIDLLSKQLQRMMDAEEKKPTTYSVQDLSKLMQIAEKLGTMKKKAREEADPPAGPEAGEGFPDWDSDPMDDDI